MYVLYHTQEQLKPTTSRPNLQRDAFLAHAMHLVVVERVWQTTGSIKVAASCRHGIFLWMVDCERPGVWSVVGLLYAKRARCAGRGFAVHISAVPSLCPLLPAAELRIRWFSLRFVLLDTPEYIRRVRDLDRNLPNIPGTIESIRAVLCPPIFTADLFVLSRKLCLYLY